jgi:hypothetical protein
MQEPHHNSARSPRPGEAFNPWRGARGFYPPDVLGRQQTLAGRDGQCFPSLERLSSELGEPIITVRRQLAELEALSLIAKVRRGKRLFPRFDVARPGDRGVCPSPGSIRASSGSRASGALSRERRDGSAKVAIYGWGKGAPSYGHGTNHGM